MSRGTMTEQLVESSRSLGRAVDQLRFAPPVAYVYNPLVYASGPHELYLARLQPRPEALLVGMNPGPWGMSQTGVPFGEVASVRDWLGIAAAVSCPVTEHPARRVEGFGCRRSEVSGRRLWGWAQRRFATPERFFKRFAIWNYIPLLFLADSGRNITPDKLPATERKALFASCDVALSDVVATLRPARVIGIGGFATTRARCALASCNLEIGSILHPSPASPTANRGWEQAIEQQLAELGISLP